MWLLLSASTRREAPVCDCSSPCTELSGRLRGDAGSRRSRHGESVVGAGISADTQE
jgi:hypothetical protein